MRLDKYDWGYKSRYLKNLGMSRTKMNRTSRLSTCREYNKAKFCSRRTISSSHERSSYRMRCLTCGSVTYSRRGNCKRNPRRNMIYSRASRVPIFRT